MGRDKKDYGMGRIGLRTCFAYFLMLSIMVVAIGITFYCMIKVFGG